LNQACTHLPWQVVVKTHAVDLDLFDRRWPRRCSRSRAFANQLPVNPAGNFRQQKVFWSALAERSRDSALDWVFKPILDSLLMTKIHSAVAASLCRRIPKPKKEDQCQES